MFCRHWCYKTRRAKNRQRDTTHNSANFINHLLSHTLSIMNANINCVKVFIIHFFVTNDQQ